MKVTPICNYCGKIWPVIKGGLEAVPPNIRAAIQLHVTTCLKNPMVIEIAALKAENEQLLAVLKETSRFIEGYQELFEMYPKELSSIQKRLDDFI